MRVYKTRIIEADKLSIFDLVLPTVYGKNTRVFKFSKELTEYQRIVFKNLNRASPLVVSFVLTRAKRNPEKYLIDYLTAPQPLQNRL